jgi:uncharacterized protein YggL (DUF469 family)
MKRRLRKKKRIGEFQELGFEVSFDMSPELTIEQRNALLDAFIMDAIEANDLACGGGGSDMNWEVFVVAEKPRASAAEAQRQAVQAWLEGQKAISNIKVGELRDAWHGWDGE